MINEIIPADKRWEVFFQVKTHEEFVKRFVPTIFLHPAVNNEIRGIFDAIQAQLVGSYFAYESIDSAAREAVFSLETALKLRYYEVCKKDKNGTFQELLKDFQNEGYFEIENADFFNWLRFVRNHFAHPKRHSFGGLNSMRFIFIVADLINDLYENRVHRKFRINETEIINSILADFADKGSKIKLVAGNEFMFYRCLVGFINNAVFPNVVTLLYKPIFRIPKVYAANDPIELFSWRTAACTELKICQDKLLGINERGEEVFQITRLQGEELNIDWNNWKLELDAYRQTMRLFDYVDHDDAREKMALLKNSFHKRSLQKT